MLSVDDTVLGNLLLLVLLSTVGSVAVAFETCCEACLGNRLRSFMVSCKI